MISVRPGSRGGNSDNRRRRSISASPGGRFARSAMGCCSLLDRCTAAALACIAIEGRDRHAHALGDVAHRQRALLHHRPCRGDVARAHCRWAATLATLPARLHRSAEHTSELQSLMRTSYAVFCLKKKNDTKTTPQPHLINRKNKLITHREKL